MGRRTRLNIPITRDLLVPDKGISKLVQSKISLKKGKAKKCYERKPFDEHSNIPLGNYVYGKPNPRNRSSPWQFGQVINKPSPRSYVISTAKGHLRRNRAQVRPAVPPLRQKKRSDFSISQSFPETKPQCLNKESTTPEVLRESQVVSESGASSSGGPKSLSGESRPTNLEPDGYTLYKTRYGRVV